MDFRRSDNVCKGIRIKFSCGGSAAGFVYPISIGVTNLSKEELPNDQWLVIPIKGLSINGHINPRNDEVGCVCCMGNNIPHLRSTFSNGLMKLSLIPLLKLLGKKSTR